MSDDRTADDMSPEIASFWDAWGELTPDWRTLTARERCVLSHASDEAYLCDVIPYFLGHPAVGDGWIFSNDTAAIMALVPDFSRIVGQMVAAGRVEIHDTWPLESDGDDSAPVDQARIAAVLADPATWIPGPTTDGRLIKLVLANRPRIRLEPRP